MINVLIFPRYEVNVNSINHQMCVIFGLKLVFKHDYSTTYTVFTINALAQLTLCNPMQSVCEYPKESTWTAERAELIARSSCCSKAQK